MIRLSTRTVVGIVGSAVMTLCSFGVFHATLSSGDAQRKQIHSAPIAQHSDTIDAWQLAEKDLVVVRASRA